MSDIVEKIRIQADGSQAKREASDVEKRLGKMFDKSALKAAAFNQALALGQRALGGLVDGLKSGMRAALDYERTTNQLRFTLAQVGDAGATWLDTMQRQSTELERLTGQSDEQIRRLQIMALNSGVATNKVDALMKASVRLSNAYGMSLESATRNLIKTQSGLTGELGEAVPWIRKLSKEQLLAGDAISLVNEKLDSQLEVMTTGRAGAAMGLTTAWSNFGEAMADAYTDGRGFTAVLEGMTASLDQMAVIFREGGLTEGLLTMIDAFVLGNVERTGARAEQLARQAAIRKSQGSLGLPLVDVVSGQNVAAGGAGAPGVGGKGGKRGGGGGLQFAMGEGFGGAFAAGGDAIFVEGVGFISREEYTAAQNVRYEITAQVNQGIMDLQQGQYDYHAELMQKETAFLATQKAEQVAIEAKAAQARQQDVQMGIQVAQMGLGAFNNLLKDIITGSDDAAQRFASAMLSGVGQMLQGKGMAHLAEAAAIAFIPGLQGNAAGLAAAGAAEVALGTALVAGGMAAAPSGGGAATAGGGGGGGGIGAESFAGGYSSGMGSAGSSGQQGQTIIINLEGPVYDGAQAGVAIMEKIAEAKRQGVG